MDDKSTSPRGFTDDELYHQGIPDVLEASLIFLDHLDGGATGRTWSACTLGMLAWLCYQVYCNTRDAADRVEELKKEMNGERRARFVIMC